MQGALICSYLLKKLRRYTAGSIALFLFIESRRGCILQWALICSFLLKMLRMYTAKSIVFFSFIENRKGGVLQGVLLSSYLLKIFRRYTVWQFNPNLRLKLHLSIIIPKTRSATEYWHTIETCDIYYLEKIISAYFPILQTTCIWLPFGNSDHMFLIIWCKKR